MTARAREASTTTSITTPSDREIVITRAFNAPAQLVFDAHTQPEHVRRWWGCSTMIMTACEIDLRPGGSWRFAHREPDGREYAFRGVYREIAPPGRLVHTEIFEDFPDAESLVTLTFDERDGHTVLTSTSLYPSREIRDMVISSGMESGIVESYDRMEALLATMG